MDPITLGVGAAGAALGSGLLDGGPPKDYMAEIGGLDAFKTYKLRNQLRGAPLDFTGRTGIQSDAINSAGGYVDISPALAYFNNVLAGGFQNPYADMAFDKAASTVRQKMDSQFAQAGRLGSDAHQNVMADAYGDLATSIYGKERDYIDAAARTMPAVAGQGISNASALFNLGEQDRMQQQMLDNPAFYTTMMRLQGLGGPLVNPAAMLMPQMDEGNSGMGALGGALSTIGLGKELGLIGAA